MLPIGSVKIAMPGSVPWHGPRAIHRRVESKNWPEESTGAIPLDTCAPIALHNESAGACGNLKF
jgi:hypothetical protein